MDTGAIDALARLHHAYLQGLLLMIATRKGANVMGDWMFRMFRRQHLDKFLSSFEKLGLVGLPDAVACAQYHVLSNNMGGVGVEYIHETDAKAWVRFRYPRWMYDGPTLCGMPREVSLGFLHGWYGHNGVSLGNPRLGFVCVSEDMTGEFGLCGYFQEFDRELSETERVQFAKGELPPDADPESQPRPPEDQWDDLRLAKARRNYGLEYIRNGLIELATVIGAGETRKLGGLAARLIGLQYSASIGEQLNIKDGDVSAAADLLSALFRGMGDATAITTTPTHVHVRQSGLRLVRGLDEPARALVLDCWQELFRGMLLAQRQIKRLTVTPAADGLDWQIQPMSVSQRGSIPRPAMNVPGRNHLPNHRSR